MSNDNTNRCSQRQQQVQNILNQYQQWVEAGRSPENQNLLGNEIQSVLRKVAQWQNSNLCNPETRNFFLQAEDLLADAYHDVNSSIHEITNSFYRLQEMKQQKENEQFAEPMDWLKGLANNETNLDIPTLTKLLGTINYTISENDKALANWLTIKENAENDLPNTSRSDEMLQFIQVQIDSHTNNESKLREVHNLLLRRLAQIYPTEEMAE